MREAVVLDAVPGFSGRIVDLVTETVRLPNGNVRSFEIVRHPGGAAVVPIDEQGRVLLIRQYRHPVREWLLEIPAGKLDGGEPPDVCAARELEEETGRVARKLDRLGFVRPAPGYSDERVWLFIGTDLESSTQMLDPGEVLEVVPLPFEEAVSLAIAGEITDAKTVAGLFRARAWLRENGG